MKTMWTTKRGRLLLFAVCTVGLSTTPLMADLARDVGKASVAGEEGAWIVESSLEMERDEEGTTWTIGGAIKYTPEELPRLNLALEPVLWEWDEPKDGPGAEGVGDADVTASYLVRPSDGSWPAVVVAGRVKVPTASDREIGTGAFDGAALLIIGREIGDLDVNLALEYATFGQPDLESADSIDAVAESDESEDGALEEPTAPEEDANLIDQFLYTLSFDYGMTEHFSVYTELFGNTKPTRSGKASNAVGAGVEYDVDIAEGATLFIQAGMDTDRLITAKIGLEWSW